MNQGMNRRSGWRRDGSGEKPPHLDWCLSCRCATLMVMKKKSPYKPIPEHQEKASRRKTPTFLLELPLLVTEAQAACIRGHLGAGWQFYNAVLSEGTPEPSGLSRRSFQLTCLP